MTYEFIGEWDDQFKRIGFQSDFEGNPIDRLIRCKDCKFLRFTGTVWKCQNRLVMMLCEPNDYCSRAERKENDCKNSDK